MKLALRLLGQRTLRWMIARAGGLAASIALCACTGSASLVRQDSEPCSDLCPFGGTRITSGLDQDDDGALDDDEITASEYVCSACTNIVFGNVTVESAADLAALNGVCEVRGTFRVAAAFDAATIDGLDCLARVETLVVNDTVNLTTLSAPGLIEIDNLSISRNASLVTLDLPSLGRVLESLSFFDEVQGDVRGLYLSENPVLAALDLSALARSDGDIFIVQNPALSTISLGRLSIVTGSLIARSCPLLASFDVTRLEQADRVEVSDTTALAALELPVLRLVGDGGVDVAGNSALATISVPTLLSTGRLSVRVNPALTTLDLPALEFANSLELNGLEQLTAVTAPVLAGISDLWVSVNPVLEVFDLPALLGLGEIGGFISNDALDTIRFAQVTFAGSLSIYGNDAVTSVEAPLLARTAGDLTVNSAALTNLDLRALETIGGTATIVGAAGLTCLGAAIVDVGDCAP